MSDRTHWQDIEIPHFPSLQEDIKCDVLVVGGGITGLTAAYLLLQAGKSVCLIERDVIGGGETGRTNERYAEVEMRLKQLIPQAQIERRWLGQVVEMHDGLPYIGETASHQFVATGFSGNGTTFGTLAAMMACDAALGRDNPWKELFSVERKTVSSTWNYLRENFDFPFYLLRDRLTPTEGTSPEIVRQDEGKILTIDGRRVACSRDKSGKLQSVSGICTHMGCVVRWNSAAETWDCPCHGSRFSAAGEVMAGPAESDLEKVVVEDNQHATSGVR